MQVLDIDKMLSISFLGSNHWGYLLVILAAILETVPVLGIFVPGFITVMAAGFLVKLGFLTIGRTIFAATLGSIIGDVLGYYFGKIYGISFLEKYGKYFFVNKKQITKIERLLNQHTGKSILVGRFAPLTRAITPIMAGATNISFGDFLFYNVISGIIWGTAFVSLGYLFGQSYEITAHYIGEYVTIAFLVSIGIVYIYRLVNKKKHVFAKYHLHTLAINIISLYVFAKITEDVVRMEFVTNIDSWLNNNIKSLWNPSLNNIAIFITNIAKPTNILIYSTVLLIVLFIKRKWYHLLLLTTSMTLGGISMRLIKLLIHRIRPISSLINVSGYSFPSGHATMATIFFTILLYAFKNDIKNRVIKLFYILIMVLTFLLVGFSRVYLNVHWFSDVIAGFSLGIFWVSLLVLIFKFVSVVEKRWLNTHKFRF